MKIAYISSSSFTDSDIPLINELKKNNDVTYILETNPEGLCRCAVDLRKETLRIGLNKAMDMTSMQIFIDMLDLQKTYISYTPDLHPYSIARWKEMYELYRFLKQEKFDVIHFIYIPPFYDFFLYFFYKKIVLTVHDPIPHSSEIHKLTRFHRIWAFKNIKDIVLLNSRQKEEFCKLYKLNKTSRVHICSFGCLNWMHVYDKSQVQTPQKYILFFGNILSYKGLEYLFKAMKIVHQNTPDLKLVVAGNGKYYFDNSEYVNLDYFDIRNRFIPNDELSALIANSLLVVAPYVDATQSGVVISAFTYNKPCVVTNVGGLPDMVINGRYGLVVPPREAKSLASAIIELTSNPQKLLEFSDNIKEDYHYGKNSWGNISKKYIDIYEYIYNTK